MDEQNKLSLFNGKQIRKVWHNEQWYFSVIDVIEILSESPAPRQYWNIVKKRERQLSTICLQLKMTAQDGKERLTDCAHTEGIFRIVMSVPSPKAEPLRMWLAEQGKRAIDETENPELLTERQAEIYKAKGYTDEWIVRRVQTIETRKKLTDEWNNRGVKEGQEYAILTATIAKGTFGLTPTEHAKHKGLDKQNLRDHMTPMELILTALSEEVTKTIAIDDNAQGYEENHQAAVKGGEAGRIALKNVEKAIKKKVVSAENFLSSKGDKTDELPQTPIELM